MAEKIHTTEVPILVDPTQEKSGRKIPRFTYLFDLIQEPEQNVDWLIDGLIGRGSLNLLAGKPKAGKSTLARQMILDASRGAPFLGRETTTTKVVYLALEEQRSEVRRHFSLMGAVQEPILIWTDRAPNEPVVWIRQVIEEHKPDLVVIDPMAFFLRVADLNDYSQVCRAFEPLVELVRNSSCSILLVHHMGKADRPGADAILGSTGIHAAVDTAIMLVRTEKEWSISTSQRYGMNLEQTFLVFDPGTRRAGILGSKLDADREKLHTKVLSSIIEADGPISEAQVCNISQLRKADVARCIRALVAANGVSRTGKGVCGDPYLYAAKSGSAVPNPTCGNGSQTFTAATSELR